MMKILILNGPNLDIMERRKNPSYGGLSLADIERMVTARAEGRGVTIDFRQSNHEGDLVDWLHEALDEGVGGVIINPTAFTHSSWAISDAAAALSCPVIELHFSNVHRDPTKADRHTSLIRRAATGVIAGFGPRGYIAALDLLCDEISQHSTEGTSK